MRERIIIEKLSLQIEDQRDLRIQREALQLWHHTAKLTLERTTDDSDLSKHMIYQIDRQVIEHNRTIKTSSHSTQ